MNKHTPGPWKLQTDTFRDGSHLIIDDGRAGAVVATCIHPDGIEDGCEAEANARLIAAAPQLLEALDAVYTGLLTTAQFDGCSYVAQLREQARAAIAKATDRTLAEEKKWSEGDLAKQCCEMKAQLDAEKAKAGRLGLICFKMHKLIQGIYGYMTGEDVAPPDIDTVRELANPLLLDLEEPR